MYGWIGGTVNIRRHDTACSAYVNIMHEGLGHLHDAAPVSWLLHFGALPKVQEVRMASPRLHAEKGGVRMRTRECLVNGFVHDIHSAEE